jgi:hypothetical protein
LRKAGGAGRCGDGDLGLLFRCGHSVLANELSVQRTGATESGEERGQKNIDWRSMLRHYKGKESRRNARRSPVVLHDGKPSYLVIGRISTVSRWLRKWQELLECAAAS